MTRKWLVPILRDALPDHLEFFPDVVVAPGLMLAGTDSRRYAGIADNFRFSPVRANSHDLKRFHGTTERLSIEGYVDMIRSIGG